MKTKKTTANTGWLIIAMLMIGTAYADEVSNSFERDMNRPTTQGSSTRPQRDYTLPEQEEVNRAIRDQNQDQRVFVGPKWRTQRHDIWRREYATGNLAVSFDRELNCLPVTGSTRHLSKMEPDPVELMIRHTLLQ